MRSYLIALAVGLLVGAIYGLLRVRSPAPPVIALVGLLGMLLGEQIPAALGYLKQDPDRAAVALHAPAEPEAPKTRGQP